MSDSLARSNLKIVIDRVWGGEGGPDSALFFLKSQSIFEACVEDSVHNWVEEFCSVIKSRKCDL
jgi:hypothetical protein